MSARPASDHPWSPSPDLSPPAPSAAHSPLVPAQRSMRSSPAPAQEQRQDLAGRKGKCLLWRNDRTLWTVVAALAPEERLPHWLVKRGARSEQDVEIAVI